MKIILIPSTTAGGGPEHYQFSSSAVVNDTLAIDAGCLGFFRSAQDQARIKHVLISHTHIDHVASLPIFVENAYEGKPDCVTIHGSADVLDSCQRDLFNDRIWPDFIALSKNNERPFLKLARFDPGQTIELEGLRITAVSLDHVVPTVGFLVEDQHAAVAFVSDTGPTEEIWRVCNRTPNLKGVFLEGCFPNNLEWLAKVSRHLTPAMVAAELKKLTRPARIHIVHIKARFQTQIIAELRGLGLSSLEIAQFGVPYSF
jgi:ribonuclease BN (tRNA processing enzyme)